MKNNIELIGEELDVFIPPNTKDKGTLQGYILLSSNRVVSHLSEMGRMEVLTSLLENAEPQTKILLRAIVIQALDLEDTRIYPEDLPGL